MTDNGNVRARHVKPLVQYFRCLPPPVVTAKADGNTVHAEGEEGDKFVLVEGSANRTADTQNFPPLSAPTFLLRTL